MSSRRKSRPVRRLDTICSELHGNAECLPSAYEDHQSENSLSPPSASPQDSHQHLNSEGRESNSDEERDNLKLNAEESRKRQDNPPEGVYILQPQGVSDDEGQDADGPPSKMQYYTNEEEQHDFSNKKRQRAVDEGMVVDQHDGYHDDRVREGLDLTVKRRRTDDDSHEDKEAMSPSAHADSDNLTMQDIQTKMQRYEKLLQLLAQRQPLMESMQKVGLTQQDLVSLQRFRLQMIGNNPQNSEVNTSDEFYQSRSEPTSSSSPWNSRPQNGAADEWQGSNNDGLPSSSSGLPKPTFPSANLPPAVAAAMLASIVSNNDHLTADSTPKSEVLQNIFKRSQSIFSQGSSTPKTPTTNQYATSADAMDTITAGTVSSGVGSIKKGTLDPTNFDEDVFDKYITKFTSKNSCMQPTCPHINRDHFHCTDSDCNFQRFTNKSDVIRHYNMHKKRDNSLAHGFMRFAPTDNCSNQFGSCHLNGKSTHYHCLHTNCTKVYTSTSDVMTHENFHKKNQQFVTNGFQRYRATETCVADYCPFKHQRTTHFHCTRKDCNFTFKNKCDIEKHKAYHMRDDAYARQGFKKFYKNEPCQFSSCAWNRTANHFHCLRPNCDFSFTSTSQMVSHKRKHDRQDLMGPDRISLTPPGGMTTTSAAPMLPQAMVTMATMGGMPRQMAPSFVRPPIGPYAGIRGQHPGLLPFSFLSPFVAANLLNRPAPTMVFEQRQAGSSKFDPSVFHEAARKVLSSIPTTVAAAALPRNLNNFSPKVEQPSLQTAFMSTSTSSTATSSGADSSFQHREIKSELPTEHVEQYDHPPPPYADVPENMSNRNSPQYEQNDGYADDSSGGEQDRWSASHRPVNMSRSSPKEAVLSNMLHQGNIDTDDGQALNLSGKNDDRTPQHDLPASDAHDTDQAPSAAVLKYFRGLAPDECLVSNCVFISRHHFHCVVEHCCAIFTEKQLVLNHTAFHEKLEQMGVSQANSRQFPPFYHQASRGPSPEPASPPHGYIALPVSSRPKENFLEHGPNPEQRKIVLSRSDFDSEMRGNVANDTREFHHDVIDKSHHENRDGEQASSLGLKGGSLYEYLSRMVQDNKAITSFPNFTQTSQPGSSSAFVMLQNPSVMASAIQNQKAPLPGMQADDQQDVLKRLNSNGQPSDGYVHIRPGMSCIRPDCKYAMQNHWHCTLNRCRYVCKSLGKAQSHRQAHDSLEAYARAAKECFRSYTVKKNCPNPSCEFRLRGHYHCLKPGCQFVTIGTSKLPWHMKKHEKIARREASGFKYYTKKEQCGKFECKYNGLFSHYHCIRAGCAFAFQYKHQMSTHVRKHLRRMLGRSYNDMPSDFADIDHTNVDSGDDSLPLIVDEADEIEQRPGVVMETNPQASSYQPQINNPTSELNQQQLAVLERISRGIKPSLAGGNDHMSSNIDPQQFPDMHNSMQRCIDQEVNSSDDEVLDLRAPALHDTDSNSVGSSSAGYPNDAQFMQIEAEKYNDDIQTNQPGFIAKSSDDNGALFTKFRLNNDVMDGFKRFEMTENCGDQQCTYAFKVSHYHCLHDGCNYRFTGRTHMFKHHQHHERVAGLVRDDFKRYKPSQDCDVTDCPYNGTSTHFHCLRCQFKCTDSAKVGTHRRQHVKADALEQSGFERFRGKEDCGRENCKYRERNTSHYHCLQSGCTYTVVGLSSIEQHYNKHKRSTSAKPSPQVNFNIFAKQLITHADSFNNSTFADSALSASHNGSYTMPFTGLSSTPTIAMRSSDGSSPVTDERSSVSPAFNTSIVTSQLDSHLLGQEKSDAAAMELPNSLNLSVNHERAGGALSGLQAGLSL